MNARATFPRWLGVGIFLALICATPGRLISWDAGVRLEVASLLWREGTVLAPASHPAAKSLIYVEERGAYTSYFGIGQSLLFVPFDMVGHALGWTVRQFRPNARTHDLSSTLLSVLYPPLVGLAWVYFLAQALCALGVSPPLATGAALAGLFTTIGFYYSTQTCQEEMTVAVLFAASLWQWALWKRAPQPSHAFWGALLGSAPLLFRLNAVFAGLALAGYLFWQRGAPSPLQREYRKHLPPLLWGAALPLGLFALFAWWRFGSPFATGYHLVWRTEPYASMGNPMGPVRPGVALELLLGLGKGMIPFSPILALSFLGLWRMRKEQPGLALGCVAMWLGSAAFHSRVAGWPDGSECWGNRYLVHTLSLAALPTWVGAQWLWHRRRGRTAVGALLALGFAIQVSSILMPEGIEYVQNVSSGRPQHEGLLTSDLHGQLPRRLTNTLRWLTGSSLADTSPALETMVTRYVPNLWGPVYGKRFGGVWSVLWLLALAAAAGAMTRASKALRSAPSPEAQPKRSRPSQAA